MSSTCRAVRPIRACAADAERPAMTRRQLGLGVGGGAAGALPGLLQPSGTAEAAIATGAGRVQEACSSFTLANGMRFVVLQRSAAPLVREAPSPRAANPTPTSLVAHTRLCSPPHAAECPLPRADLPSSRQHQPLFLRRCNQARTLLPFVGVLPHVRGCGRGGRARRPHRAGTSAGALRVQGNRTGESKAPRATVLRN
jgi:hypothetical protein